MVFLYFDTSAIVKRYHQEKGSDIIDEIFKSKGERGFVTSFWTVLEFVVAFSAKKRRGEISEKSFDAAMAAFLKDLTDFFTVRNIDDDIVGSAIPNAVKHGLSSADCVHIATLLELQNFCKETHDKLVFISADDEQCRAAKDEGIKTVNPRDSKAAQKLSRI